MHTKFYTCLNSIMIMITTGINCQLLGDRASSLKSQRRKKVMVHNVIWTIGSQCITKNVNQVAKLLLIQGSKIMAYINSLELDTTRYQNAGISPSRPWDQEKKLKYFVQVLLTKVVILIIITNLITDGNIFTLTEIILLQSKTVKYKLCWKSMCLHLQRLSQTDVCTS